MEYNFFRGGQNQPQGDPGENAEATAIFKRGMTRRLIIIIGVLIVVFFYMQCVVITKPNEYVVIQQFGEIKSVTAEPGISFKLPFIQVTRSVPKMVRIYDIPISDVITQDKKTMVADSFVLWKVSDPTKFIRTLSGSVANAEVRIGNIAYNSMKNVISQLPQTEIISGRDTLAVKIFENIGSTLDQYGVDLIAIETKHLDLPDDNKQAVYTRMISERNNIAASFSAEGEEEGRKIRNETDRSVSVLLSQANAAAAQTIAEGEQRYMEILAEAYNDPEKAEFYAFNRALDAAKASLQNGDTTLILSPDSPIAQVFYNIG
ncbi:MAG: protease modulator HflC [Oscillospiraceae bacterium]|jgi:membrane protease subunit HflC|nr:protease modulator HflC [Oscillospiraceae bacterium]